MMSYRRRWAIERGRLPRGDFLFALRTCCRVAASRRWLPPTRSTFDFGDMTAALSAARRPYHAADIAEAITLYERRASPAPSAPDEHISPGADTASCRFHVSAPRPSRDGLPRHFDGDMCLIFAVLYRTARSADRISGLRAARRDELRCDGRLARRFREDAATRTWASADELRRWAYWSISRL